MGFNEELKDFILVVKKNGSIDVVFWFCFCLGGEGLDYYRIGE